MCKIQPTLGVSRHQSDMIEWIQFFKWINSPLLLYSLFSEAPTGSGIAHLLTGSPTYNGCDSYHSQEHKRDVNVLDYFAFITKHSTEENLKSVLEIEFLQRNKAEVVMIKHGLNMWDTSPQSNLNSKQFCESSQFNSAYTCSFQ